MKVSEDRFPLLFVYFEDQEEPYNVRTRTITKGAAEVLSRWPHYLTFASYMSVIGLLSLLVCFILSVVVLSLTATETHNPRRFSVVKCGSKAGSSHYFHLNVFDHITDADNATFIVDLCTEGRDPKAAACAIESYLTWTTLPVYHIRLLPSRSAPDNASAFRDLEKFINYRQVTSPIGSFLSGTAFAGDVTRDAARLRLVAKVLLSWNFGGVVLDSDLLTLVDHGPLTRNPNDTLLVGVIGPDAVLLSSQRVCHSFVFDLLRYLEANANGTAFGAVETVRGEFCSRGRNCSSVRVVSEPEFCAGASPGCVFARFGNDTDWDRVCPISKGS